MAFAVPMNTSEISLYQAENSLFTQADDVGFAARAPPLAAANVTVTDGVTVMQGGTFALHGQETVVALFGFDRPTNVPNRTFDLTSSGAGNDLRRFTTLDGTDVRINSGHAYNRTHAGGDVSQIGTMDEIENAILRDISSNSRLGNLQPRTTQTHTVQVNGQSVGYSLADTPVGANINYYPVIE